MNIKSSYYRDLKAVKMTSTAVAEKIGISRQSLYKRLNRSLSLENAIEIWKAMGYEFYVAGPDKKAKKFESQ